VTSSHGGIVEGGFQTGKVFANIKFEIGHNDADDATGFKYSVDFREKGFGYFAVEVL